MPSISTQLANKGKSSSKVFGRMDGKLKKYTPVTGCILTNSHLNANDSGFGRTCRMSTRCEETRTARCSVCTSEQCKNCPSCSSDRVTHNCGNSHTVESSSHVCKEHSSRGHKRGFEPVDTRQAVAALKDLLNITGSVKSRGASTVAIDNKIEQAMDLVKSHLMFAVREEVLVLKEQIKELLEKNSQLEYENSVLRNGASAETLDTLAKLQPATNPGQTQQTQSSS